MNGNGKGPMDKGQRTGRQLGYCSGYKNAGFENRTNEGSFGRKFGQGFRRGFGQGSGQGFEQDVNYTEKELLNLRKINLQGELEIIEEKLKNL